MIRSSVLRGVMSSVFLAVSCCAWAQDDVVQRAMRDELARSMQKLQLEDLAKPYFIAYRVQDIETTSTAATFGALSESNESRRRWLTVEVRVGSHDFDNSNFLSINFGRTGVAQSAFGAQLPLEDNYQEIRRQIWLATDAAYKKAVEDLSGKRAALQNRTRTEQVPDFSQEEPVTATDERPPLKVRRSDMEQLVRSISALFRQMPDVDAARVQYTIRNLDLRYMNSEGTVIHQVKPSLGFTVLASTQAPDGMPLNDFVAIYGSALSDLPAQGEITARVKEMGARLAKLRQAPLLARYSGPVLFEGQAAAALFSQTFATKLVASRPQVSDNPQLERSFSMQQGSSFVDKLGARVLPGFLSVTDDPTSALFDGKPPVIRYRVDDDGVRARTTRVVEHGTLVTLLTGRMPVEGVLHSTGNRRGAGPVPSNLMVTAENGLSDDALRRQFLSMLSQRKNEFGVVIHRMGNPMLKADRDLAGAIFIGSGRDLDKMEGAIAAYKLYADGREELIRNLELSDFAVLAFKDIVAAGNQAKVFTEPFKRPPAPFAFGGGPMDSAPVLVSVAVPALLFDELTVRKPLGEVPKPPTIKHPFFDNP